MLVRRVRADDAAAIAAIYRPYVEEARTSFELTAPDAVEIGKRIAKCGDQYPWLVAMDLDGCVTGYAYATAFRDRPAYRFAVETTVYLSPAAQGQRIGRTLYAILLEILTTQGFVHAIGAITVPNPASVALHRTMGYVDTGVYQDIGYKMGAWASVQLLQKTLCDLPNDPSEPLPLSACAAWLALAE